MYYNCCCTLQLLWQAGLQIHVHVLVHVKLTMRKGYSITEPKYLHSKGIGIKMKHAKQNSLIIKIRNRNKKLKFWIWNIGKTFKPGINCRHIIFFVGIGWKVHLYIVTSFYSFVFRGVCKQFGANTGRITLAVLLLSAGMFISSTAYLPSSFCMYMTLLSMGAWFLGHLQVTHCVPLKLP